MEKAGVIKICYRLRDSIEKINSNYCLVVLIEVHICTCFVQIGTRIEFPNLQQILCNQLLNYWACSMKGCQSHKHGIRRFNSIASR